ncbi:MAG: ATP-binding protein [Methylococcaceae bacterium]|nr:ATP-binding protein [Methylococcaceae bacterium]
MKFLKRLDSLFVKTSLTLTFGLSLFILLATSFTWFFILNPLSTGAANDMAALINITAKTWVSLPEQERKKFEKKIAKQHAIFFSHKNNSTQKLKKNYPFVRRLQKAIQKYTGQQVLIEQKIDNHDLLCFKLGYAKTIINICYFHSRPGPSPPIAITGIFIAATFLVIILTLLLVRRITRPVKKLSNAANLFGKGQYSIRIPETGPTELALLAHSFNQMAKEIAHTIENRAILFGGISHDLRSPITRMQVALDLLDQDQDKTLITHLKNDLSEMELLIQQSLDFVKGLDKQNAIEINLDDVFNTIIDDYRKQDLYIKLLAEPCGICKIDIQALRRVLSNLLDNAFHYGSNSPVTLSYKKEKHQLFIQVVDEGPGIPLEKLDIVFQPFYRLEHSRNKKKGGSGLGLAIVKQLCDAHGWEVKLLLRKSQGLEARLQISICN